MLASSSNERLDTAVKWVLGIVASWVTMMGITWGIYDASVPERPIVAAEQIAAPSKTADLQLIAHNPAPLSAPAAIDVASNEVGHDQNLAEDAETEDDQAYKGQTGKTAVHSHY